MGCRDLVRLLWRSLKAFKTIYYGLEVAEVAARLTHLSRLESISAGPDYLGPWLPDLRSNSRKKSMEGILYALRTGSR